MPSEDSKPLEQVERQGVPSREAGSEEIVTPIEAEIQSKAEKEFETERKIPKNCKCAIVSVNGEDVEQVPLPSHDRAA